MKKTKMPCGISSLTDDILVDILTRLTAKVVVQCKCVCKHWRSLIEDPSFVESHNSRAKSRPGSCCLVISMITYDYDKLHIFSANYEGGPAQHLLTYSMSGLHHIKQSVNGLICGYLAKLESVFVANPMTKEIVVLPPSGIKTDRSSSFSERWQAFGFEPPTKQFKVLDIRHVLQQSTDGSPNYYHYECEIFTLGTHSWRKIDVVPLLSQFEFGSNGVCVDGVIHWRNTSYLMKPSIVEDEVIVAFDLRDETFRSAGTWRPFGCL